MKSGTVLLTLRSLTWPMLTIQIHVLLLLTLYKTQPPPTSLKLTLRLHVVLVNLMVLWPTLDALVAAVVDTHSTWITVRRMKKNQKWTRRARDTALVLGKKYHKERQETIFHLLTRSCHSMCMLLALTSPFNHYPRLSWHEPLGSILLHSWQLSHKSWHWPVWVDDSSSCSCLCAVVLTYCAPFYKWRDSVFELPF